MGDGTELGNTLQDTARPRLVLVTGPSGAGRSTAIKTLEDIGFEAIDNLPLGLVERLFSGPPLQRSLALGLDARNRDFSPRALLELLQDLESHDPELLYLDCSREILQRRYSETRRRHPMSPNESAAVGIDREKELLVPVRDCADALIDTSELTIHALRQELERRFAPQTGRLLAVSLVSFSYKRGLPQGLDIVHDCRFLRNPYWDPSLRDLTGKDPEVAAYVAQDERFENFFLKLSEFLSFLLPAYRAEGKSHLTIGLGCTGGQHRSVFVTEKLAEALAPGGWQVSIRHREIDRREGEVAVRSNNAGSGVAKA
ncbi:RNase adapter RapZ [Cognatishimia sp. WU-CL00825]|uniref:RNase adapter RapZ n=1 Tax=Cognatishimia sp. WU-CL00825 TaxID=3127658 RepID=UPI00310BDD8F